ncbi:MAG: hypothetical protein KKE73_00340 [Proteobacteria bacterium]|nr:hypothetical protein [Pseudomonadota bacterium]
MPDITSPEMQERFVRLAQQMERIARDVPQAGSRFLRRCDELLQLARIGEPVPNHLERLIDIRAVVHLWATSDVFRTRQPTSAAFFKVFEGIAPQASRISLLAMVSLFFEKYDLLGDGLADFRAYLFRQIVQSKSRQIPAQIKAFVSAAKTLLGSTAPQVLCGYALQNGLPLDVVLDRSGVPKGKENRFSSVCQNYYYIDTLKRLGVGEDSPVFFEVVKPSNATMPYEDGLLLGHKVIVILLDKCMATNTALPEIWRDVILEIAGDPRVPVGSRNYRLWWNEVGVKRTQWTIQWLSQLDLGIFFEVLKEYAETSGRDDLKRMFPARERFLLGLYELGLIQGSRLFLGGQAISFLKSRIEKKALPCYATLSDSNKAVIYLNLGNVHMIEGTHSFPLLLLDRLPSDTPILSYDKSYFHIDDLNRKLLGRHELMVARGEAKIGHTRLVHYPASWQGNALSALKKYGLDIHPSRVLDRDSYYSFREHTTR